MYDELIKKLGYLAKVYRICENENTQEYKLAVEAADAIEELSRRCKQFQYMPPPAWIPVTERLPEYNLVVLVTDGEDVGTGCRYALGETGFTGWAVPFADIEEDDVSHWMPLPEPPKEET